MGYGRKFSLSNKSEKRCNGSAQDFALAAKSVRICKFCQKGICPSPKAIWNGQIL